MKLIIDIDDEAYNRFKKAEIKGYVSIQILISTILNGVPLPKGHGRLIDESKICKAIPAEEDNCIGMGMTFEEMDAYNEGIDAMYSLIKGADTIIEADKESEDKE